MTNFVASYNTLTREQGRLPIAHMRAQIRDKTLFYNHL